MLKSLWVLVNQLIAIAFLKARCVVMSHYWEYRTEYTLYNPYVGIQTTQICKRCGDKRTETELF